MIHLDVHYCDEIIRHAENDKYSPVGIFTDECRIPTQQFILGHLCLSISFSTEGGYMQASQIQLTSLEIVRNDDVISGFEIPPHDSGGTGENVSLILHQTVSGFPVSNGDRIYVRMKTHGHIISENHPLLFTWFPYYSQHTEPPQGGFLFHDTSPFRRFFCACENKVYLKSICLKFLNKIYKHYAALY